MYNRHRRTPIMAATTGRGGGGGREEFLHPGQEGQGGARRVASPPSRLALLPLAAAAPGGWNAGAWAHALLLRFAAGLSMSELRQRLGREPDDKVPGRGLAPPACPQV